MLPEEYEFLKQDIRQHGLKHAIVLYQGKILDGWHRYRICLELSIKPRFVTLDQDAEILAEAITQNLARRQLIPAQRYGVFLRIADKFPEVQARIDAAKQNAKRRQEAGRGRSEPQLRQRSSEAVGQMCGVSHATVERVDRLRRLSPEWFEEVMEGKTTFLHALNRAAAGARRVRQEALNGEGAESSVRIVCGDFRKGLAKETLPSISLAWADMPWDRGSLSLW